MTNHSFTTRIAQIRPIPMKVLIVDDHALIRDALSRVLTSLEPDTIVLEVAEPRFVLETIEREPDLDLVLLDLALPGMCSPE